MKMTTECILVAMVIIRGIILGSGRKSNTSRVMSASKMSSRLMKNYDKSEPPPKGPTRVKLGIYINSFYDISEQTMDYSLNIYLRQRWTDPRLTFEPFNNEKEQKIKLEDYMWDKIWTPDIFFRNEKKADFHTVTTPNRLIFLHSNGQVWYVSKISMTLSCPMHLHKYPLDTQSCPMMFESFGYTTKHIIFEWLESPIEYEPGIELPQFSLVNFTQGDCLQNYTTGLYPCMKIDFMLKRDIGFYIIQLYVPSVLIVILSWVAFWISVDAIPARVTIGLLTVLTMTTQSTGSQQSNLLPRVSYIKAIDVWMLVCLIFVFASLLEFAVVNVFSRKEMRIRRRNHLRKVPLQQSEEETALDQFNIVINHQHSHGRPHQNADMRFLKPDPDGRQKARYIDKIARRLFPLAFLSFNLIYWLAYILG